jgi:pimeloyl-ACP methyl ester carboxylesterase
MPAVLVHGVPDTHHLWSDLRSNLKRNDVLTPDLPGFSTPLPDGFEPVKESYVDWLVKNLEAIGEPVDLVGHDWGALLTLRVVSLRPDLIRTWALGAGASDPSYTWHPTAQIWQTPGTGEQFMAGMVPATAIPALVGGGMPQAYAEECVKHIDDTMKDCILKLYRSATNYMNEWDAELTNMPKNGLMIWGADDPYMPIAIAEKMAARVGARLVSMPETGHWWPAQRPKEVAVLLEEHWAKS